jgi:hypothetical protein
MTPVLGRPAHYDAVSIEDRRAQLETAGLAPWRVDPSISFSDWMRSADPISDTVRHLTGRPLAAGGGRAGGPVVAAFTQQVACEPVAHTDHAA